MRRTLELVVFAVFVACVGGPPAAPHVHFELRRIARGGGAALLARDVDGDGRVDLVSAADSVRTFLATGGGNFRMGPVSPAGEHPVALAFADFDEDGRWDLAVANHDTDYVSVLLGDGRGAFASAAGSPIRPGMSPHPHSVAAGDVGGDGHADILVDDRDHHALLLLQGRGDGSFAPPRSIPVGGDPYRVIWLGDLDDDGALDILTPNERSVAVLLGDGEGAFHPAPGSPFPAVDPFALVVADVDGNGSADVATAPGEGTEGVSVLLGDGHGGFRPAPWSPVPGVTGPSLIAAGDLDGDGYDDLVLASYRSERVTILYGGDAGPERQEERVGRNPWSLLVRDLDGDGRPDVGVGNDGSHDIAILLDRGG